VIAIFNSQLPKVLENRGPAVSIHSMRLRAIVPLALLAFCELALGQTKFKAPCEYAGELLQDSQRRAAFFTSDEMKARATHKQDISGPIKQWDIKGTAIVDVLVAPDGHVVCTKSLTGHPMVRKSVEDALMKWKFSAAEMDGRQVAYVGRMEFALCNISCGDSGPSMTILK
jgi:hypothetical protein